MVAKFLSWEQIFPEFFPEFVYFFPELVYFFPELVYFFLESLVYFFLESSEAPTLRMTRSLRKGYGFHCPN